MTQHRNVISDWQLLQAGRRIMEVLQFSKHRAGVTTVSMSGLREASRLARSLPACTLTWGDVDQIGDRIERWTQSEAFASARDRHLR